MRICDRVCHVVIALACVVFVADTAYAQGSIVGIVRDSSGGVLPGVTVEAASPALIEKVRSGVTDETGQYQILRLPPGTYTVTFLLPGFNAFQRGGVELTGTFTATVNADLRVGAVEETVTVTGESPIIDTRSATLQRVVDRQILDTIPAGRTAFDFAVQIPGVQLASGFQDVGGSAVLASPQRTVVSHGARGESILLRNGVVASGQAGSESSASQNMNPIGTQEMVFDTAAASAEHSSGGTRINYIPREGSNTFSGTVFLNFANSSMQSDNFTPELKAAGLSTPDSLKRTYDVNPGFGGRLKRDKVWFFVSSRLYIMENYASGAFYNRNANNPNSWTYEPDLSRPAYNGTEWKDLTTRVTWQATAKNKVGFYWQDGPMEYFPYQVSVTVSPDGARRKTYPLQRSGQIDWVAPVSNRVLLEAGGNFYRESNLDEFPDDLNPSMISVQEQSTGLVYRSPASIVLSERNGVHLMAAASYITGSHALKVGATHTHGYNQRETGALSPVSYRFNNGVPNRITQTAAGSISRTHLDHSLGVYVQDRWAFKRLTTSYGLRFDYISSGWPVQTLGPSPLTPTRNITVPAGSGLNWKDITPRFAAVYDPFGSGKTALKISINKSLEGVASGHDIVINPNPANTLVSSTTRSWNDANRNFVPDCNLLTPTANGECGALASLNFGLPAPATALDPNIRHGWGKRMYNWEFATSLQHEILPRTSLDVGYYRRWFGNQRTTINRAAPASAFDFFDVTAPSNTGLPGGGGYVIKGVYNIKPEFFGQVDDFITHSSQIENWHGVDVTVSARPSTRVHLQGGLSAGESTLDVCDIQSKNPGAGFGANGASQSGLLTPLGFCHQNSPWQSQIKFVGSYTVPRVDIMVSGSLQNAPGPGIFGNYILTNAAAAPALGRPLSGAAANITVPLLSGSAQSLDALGTGTLYGDRINQLDVRVSKRLTLRRTRVTLNLDVYNALNASSVLAYNPNFAAFRTPTRILLARFAKIGAQIDF